MGSDRSLKSTRGRKEGEEELWNRFRHTRRRIRRLRVRTCSLSQAKVGIDCNRRCTSISSGYEEAGEGDGPVCTKSPIPPLGAGASCYPKVKGLDLSRTFWSSQWDPHPFAWGE
jgi:hypothetical protein